MDCAVAGPCGGCSLRHLDYAAELRAKQENVTDAFRRIGGLDVPVLDALPSPEVDRYRNKVQFPVGRDKNGAPCIGFYAGRTHRIVPCPDCKLQPGILNDIGNALCSFFGAHGIQPYDEASGKGLVRHIFLRRGAHSGQIMVCIVCTRAKLPHSAELVEQLTAQFPDIATVLVNVNPRNTNVILGTEIHTLCGPGFIEDTLCGVPVRLGPLSFYQVNTLAAERLYGIAAEYAQLQPDDLLLDLYCGMGTIGLSMVDRCRSLIGVEIVPEAIDSAKANAARMGEAVAARSRFFCADAGKAASQLAAEGLHPDVIVLDPPRKGCDEATLSAVVAMSPPPGRLRQLQPLHRRKRRQVAGNTRLPHREGPAGGSVSEDEACRSDSFATKRNLVEIIRFTLFSRHVVFDGEGDKLRNKRIENHITVSVVIDMECGNTKN